VQTATRSRARSIDDERSVLGHQRNFAEENFLLFDMRMVLLPVSGSLSNTVRRNGDFDARGGRSCCASSHSGTSYFQLQAHGIAAAIAEGHDVLVERAQRWHSTSPKWNGSVLDGGAAGGFRHVERRWCRPLRFPHLHSQLPIELVDELELAQAAEIGNRKTLVENALEPGVVTFAGQQVHLQEAFVRLLLNLDQVRNRDRGS